MTARRPRRYDSMNTLDARTILRHCSRESREVRGRTCTHADGTTSYGVDAQSRQQAAWLPFRIAVGAVRPVAVNLRTTRPTR